MISQVTMATMLDVVDAKTALAMGPFPFLLALQKAFVSARCPPPSPQRTPVHRLTLCSLAALQQGTAAVAVTDSSSPLNGDVSIDSTGAEYAGGKARAGA